MGKPIKLSFQLIGGKNSVIPKGVKENLRIAIYDEKATYSFNSAEITKKFSESQTKDGVRSIYDDEYKLCICIYPKMEQKQIHSHIFRRLKALGAKKK
ncbi:MAG: hypothetical protein U9Q97_06595 [Acidobacteriota bacterium]|nr:hypothetical protein [Acidobacteriota bacterium]